MTARPDLDHIDLHLIRVMHTLISERSVSRAALRLSSTQPAVSAKLKRLRALTGDPLLVRAGQGMQPTERAMQLLDPAAIILQQAARLFDTRDGGFEPASSTAHFRLGASDYLDPLFLPRLVAHLQRVAPGVTLELAALTQDADYRGQLAAGTVDLVIGNWLQPPEELHLGRLLSDEIVCLVGAHHPAGRSWTAAQYLAAEHVAPMPLHPGAVGVIDQHLAALGLKRHIAVRASHFGLIPQMVADSLLVLTTGRLFCSRYLGSLPLRVLRCPLPFPPMNYYQLWHEAAHAGASQRWLREQVRDVARRLPGVAKP